MFWFYCAIVIIVWISSGHFYFMYFCFVTKTREDDTGWTHIKENINLYRKLFIFFSPIFVTIALIASFFGAIGCSDKSVVNIVESRSKKK